MAADFIAPCSDAAPARLRFGAFEADPAASVLRRGGVEVPLRRQTWQLLMLLAARPHELCSREELVARLWPRAVVGDDSLVQCVVELRRGLRDDRRLLVRTVHRRGYRLDIDVRASIDPEPLPPTPARSAAALAPAWQALTEAASRQQVVRARRLFEAGADDSSGADRADAMAGIALSHVIEVLNRWAACPRWSVTLAREAADEAVGRDAGSAMACHARAHVAMQDGEPISALLGFRAALARDPRLSRARLRMGLIELEQGHAERTAGYVRHVVAGAEGDTVLLAQASFIDGMAAFALGRDEHAEAAMQRVLALRPGDGLAHEWLAALSGLRGASRAGAAHLAAFRERVPGHTLDSLRATERSHHPVFRKGRDRLYDGLRRVGLQ